MCIRISYDLNSIFTRQTSEKVAYKPGLENLLECFLPSTFARKISKRFETGRVAALSPPLPPLSCTSMEIYDAYLHFSLPSDGFFSAHILFRVMETTNAKS